MKRIFDAKDAVLGRLASKVAKAALLGDEVVVVNCEFAVISGSRYSLQDKWVARKDMGQPIHGPFFPRVSDRFVRRTIRGMLPFRQAKGQDAFRRVECYLGVPEEFKNTTLERIKNAEFSQLRGTKYVLVKDICKFMGGRA